MQLVAWFQSIPYPWGVVILFGGVLVVLLLVILLLGKSIFSGNGEKDKPSNQWEEMTESELLAFLAAETIAGAFACAAEIAAGDDMATKQVVCDYLKEKHLMKEYLLRLGTEGYPAVYAIDLWPYLKEDDYYKLLLEKFRLKCSLDEQLAAKEFFEAVQDTAALPYLLQGVVQPERYVLSRIAEALIPLGTVAGKALTSLLSMVSAQTALGILAILEQMPGQFPMEPVLACMNHEEWTIRMAAIHVLAGQKNAAPQLVQALDDKQWQVRAAAVKALGEMYCYPAKDKIRSMLADESKGVRIAVEKAIQKLS